MFYPFLSDLGFVSFLLIITRIAWRIEISENLNSRWCLRTYFSFAGLVRLFDLVLLIKRWSSVPASCSWSWKNLVIFQGICTYSSHQAFQVPTLVGGSSPILPTTTGCLWIILCVKLFLPLAKHSLFGEPHCEEEHCTFVWEVKKEEWMYSPSERTLNHGARKKWLKNYSV